MLVGQVVHGNGQGKPRGYPTANLAIEPRAIKLADGVYAARASLLGQTYGAAVMVWREAGRVEAYLFDYQGPDFYGAAIEVEALQRVSGVERLSPELLEQKIARDIDVIRQILNDYV